MSAEGTRGFVNGMIGLDDTLDPWMIDEMDGIGSKEGWTTE